MTDGPEKKATTAGGSEATSQQRAATDRRVLDILVCPVTRDTLIYDRARAELVSRIARLAYPIRDGVPIMIVSEARTLEDDERPGFGPSNLARRTGGGSHEK